MSNKDSKTVSRLDRWFLISSVVILIIVVIISTVTLIYLSNNLIKAFSTDGKENGPAIEFNLDEYRKLGL
ncbi:MAG: hypothetical protein COT88_02110 [Candidatus Colwellbacteria bacterium CG10_big_fil_rev_8_21_14_0_10_41_28]|uniref:Uncharacterized protein n=1 Tax=Candidatus Colwellbacteria bacterium CG10_big_fil_rev_8_21_14_0_10_41_28 TaxID=1974539 RepID=A0A2H0VGY9_9BACT|nr:MAG: hypothetical protein COT88_02110 [Candidatus Colwellbacteria bacterium CG10_big_fil_rev_8_21_14_0_10_41_28]